MIKALRLVLKFKQGRGFNDPVAVCEALIDSWNELQSALE